MGLTSEGVPFNSGLYCKMTCQVLWRHFWLDWRWHVCRQDSVESPLGIYHFNGHLKALLVEMYAVTWSLSGWKSPVCCFYCHGGAAMGFYSNNETIIASYHHRKKRTAIQKGLSSLLFPMLKQDVLLWSFLDRIAYVWRFFSFWDWKTDMSFLNCCTFPPTQRMFREKPKRTLVWVAYLTIVLL